MFWMKKARPTSKQPGTKTDAAFSLQSLESRQLLAIALPPGFAEELVVSGLDTPTAMDVAPDGRLFVAEKGGTVRIVTNDGQLRSQPFLTVSADVFRERGLGGIVLDPNFSQNGYVYVYYTKRPAANPNQQSNGAMNRLSRFTVSGNDPNLANASSEQVLLDNILASSGYHNGGAMQFGADGMLYVGVGDLGNSANSQNLNSLAGKILRLNVKNLSNVVPSDNPFVGQSGRRGEVWAYGLRNPFTMAIKPGTNVVYANDVGQSTWEEVNNIVKGGNYGWPASEGNSSDPSHIDPIAQHNHDGGGAAITGGLFYDGDQFPAQYKGQYFFSDYLKQFIRTIDQNGNVATFGTDVTAALDLDMAPDGSIYYLSGFGGEYTHPDNSIFKISFDTGQNRNPTARARVRPKSGLTPLQVTFNASRSTDPDGDTLKYQWRFGDGTRANGVNASHAYNKKGTFNASLIVTDGNGGRSVKKFTVVAGSTPPRVKIDSPAKDAFYTAGQTIRYSATASDAQDGEMGDKDYVWSFVFHHNTHTHPFIQRRVGREGSFKIPRTGEVDPDQFYRLTLTVKDSTGLVTTRHVDVKPKTATMTLRTNVPGIDLTLDGQQITEGSPIRGVVGMRRDFAAPSSVTVNGTTYDFVGWSNGKDRTHSILTASRNRTYTAMYEEA